MKTGDERFLIWGRQRRDKPKPNSDTSDFVFLGLVTDRSQLITETNRLKAEHNCYQVIVESAKAESFLYV